MSEMHLALHLDPEEQVIRVGTLMYALKRFVRLLQTLQELVPKEKLEWIVEDLGKASAHIMVSPVAEPEVRARVCLLAEDGLAALESGDLPPYLPETTIWAARALADFARNTKTRMVISGPRRRVQLTVETIRTADRILRTVWEDYGSVEGTLEMITVHGRYQFNVYEALTGDCVACYFGPDLFEQAKAGLMRRVSVSGLVRYTATGRIAQVVAEHIHVFPDDQELPSVEDMAGVAPNITNGLPLEQYLRKLKDEW